MKDKGTVIVGKKALIKKAGSQVFIAVVIGSIVVSFSVIFIKFLWGIKVHNDHVWAEKNTAKIALENNVKNLDELKRSYLLLDNNESVNARTILDALPSKYDYPALATSIENLVTKGSSPVVLTGFTGTDQQLEVQQKSSNPQPVEVPFTVTVKGSYDNIKGFIERLQKSIRPMKVANLSLSGNNADMEATIDVVTYYQPAQDLTIETRTVE